MKQDIKQKIIWDTIRLIEKKDSRLMDIPVRDICREAGISISQINYHFQTKENLIAQCVQVMIGDIISRSKAVEATIHASSAVEKLKCMLKLTFGFLYNNENISKISILTDHQKPHEGDNTAQTICVYLDLVEAALREENIPYDPLKMTTMIILDFQGVFLRTDVIMQDLHMDLREESKRNQWVDEYVDHVFRPFYPTNR
jgi:AcrR family transcriptional regulator